MTDRESIVAYLRAQAKSAAGADSNDPIERMIADAIAAAAAVEWAEHNARHGKTP